MPLFTPLPRSVAVFGVGVWVALLPGCQLSEGEVSGSPAGRPGDVGPFGHADAGTFGPGQSCDIQALLALPENGCANAGCHGARFQGGLDLASPGVAQRLQGAVSQTDACKGQPLVDPTNVDNSLLLRLIDPDRFAAAPCGVMMPLGRSTGVSPKTLACFEAWVTELSTGGLPPTEPLPEPPPEFEATGPESYVNKVKTLLTGQPATTAEVARVAADQAALTSLVSEWVKTPEHGRKLLDFLPVALQQQLEGSLDAQFGRLRNPMRLSDLRANLAESFTRTAAAIIADDRPFSEILTTRRWAVTTATLASLVFLDAPASAQRVKNHTVLSGAGTSSAATRTWYLPGATCTPASPIDDSKLFEVMVGTAGCKANGVYRFRDTFLTDADFADWHMVEFVPATAAAPVPKFYDLEALRGVSKIPLKQRRQGFFTTPAFLANWETNEDNQFRVTTSQTLIVALGQAFSPADATKPARLDGLATEHAAPGTTCYGCHQFLDPMRTYFARHFSFAYKAPEMPSQITPSFAFRGTVQDGGTLGDFATTLAAHPDFATGWTQKLCYWANSQPCDEGDPEFKRVAASFVSHGFSFKRLVVELMSSPLVTGAVATQSARAKELFVSTTRRQHLCQLLDVRLGVENACQEAANFAGLVPEDAFSRGSPEPVQSAVTGLFHFAAAEKLCLRLATKLVAAGATARFPITNPEAALDSFVADLMGLEAGHTRAAKVRTVLGAHYESAKASTNPGNALRSAFVVACLSPEVMALGL